MTTATTAPLAKIKTARRRRDAENRFVISAVSWRDYELIGRVFQDRPIKITYDRGRLEIMTLSFKHERRKHLLRKLLDALVEELHVEILGAGGMTFKRKKKKKGLEPDECFWIQHEVVMRGKKEFNIETDPPPDLVLEVEITRSVLDRLGIYAALNVPEVWRCGGPGIRVCRLVNGEYEETDRSLAFPFLNPTALRQFLDQHEDLGEVGLTKQFRKWVRSQIAAGWPNGGV